MTSNLTGGKSIHYDPMCIGNGRNHPGYKPRLHQKSNAVIPYQIRLYTSVSLRDQKSDYQKKEVRIREYRPMTKNHNRGRKTFEVRKKQNRAGSLFFAIIKKIENRFLFWKQLINRLKPWKKGKK